ncbi:hypothetical protein [Streptomyces sp. NPDC088196]|uniref:hypothetical protein n=1 Tax=Streptomyces sp. NPDC088196 TaxID=3154868 RepID=UPI00344B281D
MSLVSSLKTAADGSGKELKDLRTASDQAEKSLAKAGKTGSSAGTNLGTYETGAGKAAKGQDKMNKSMKGNFFGLRMSLLQPLIDKAIATAIRTYVNVWKSIITGVLKAISTIVSTVWKGIKAVISPVVSWVKSAIPDVFVRGRQANPPHRNPDRCRPVCPAAGGRRRRHQGHGPARRTGAVARVAADGGRR